VTKCKAASKERKDKRLSKLVLEKGVGLLLTIMIGSLIAVIAYGYNERPIVYFSADTPTTFCLDQDPFCLVIQIWNTGGTSAWVDIVITIQSSYSLPSIQFLQRYYVTLVKVSVLLIGRATNYTSIPICIDLQRTSEKHDVTIDVSIRFTLHTIFREQHGLSPASYRYRKQNSSEYVLGG